MLTWNWTLLGFLGSHQGSNNGSFTNCVVGSAVASVGSGSGPAAGIVASFSNFSEWKYKQFKKLLKSSMIQQTFMITTQVKIKQIF